MATISYEDILEKDILDLLDLQALPQEEKQKIYGKLYETIENRAILRVDSLLEENDFATWKTILESGNRAEADAFLAERDIDVTRILIEEAALVKAQLVFLTASPEQLGMPDTAPKPAGV